MNTPSLRFRCLFVAGLLACTVLAAPGAARQLGSAAVTRLDDDLIERVSGSHGVHEHQGRPVGLGRNYRADFEPGRVEFAPALGEQAHSSSQLSFELEGVWLGDQLVHAADPNTAAAIDGDTVTYARGSSIRERYQVAAGGILQSFLFDSLPTGSGDLIVRGRLDTNLPVPIEQADGGLRFEVAGLGSVNFGAVTGIDADGLTVAGTLRYDGESLELVLPAAFVQNATYPLLLDPLIESVIAIEDSGMNDRNPEICYAFSSYFVVWERVFAFEDRDIMMQRISSNGDLMGGPTLIFGFGNNRDVAIGSVASSDRLLLAWTFSFAGDQTDIAIASVRYWDNDVSLSVYLDPAGTSQSDACVGGDESGADDEAFVVWSQEGVGIRACLVNVPEDGTPTAAGSPFLVDGNTGVQEAIRPDISESVGTDGDFLLVWQRRSFVNGFGQIYGRGYTRNGLALGLAPSYISGEIAFARSSRRPSCDGDGETFLVAWERSESFLDTNTDIACKSITLRPDGIDVPVSPSIIAGAPGDPETRPCVTVTGTTALVAWLEDYLWLGMGFTPRLSLFASNVDLYTGAAYGRIEVAHAADDVGGFALAAPAVGENDGSDNAMIAWGTTLEGETTGDILGRPYEGSGFVISTADGCGASGRHKIQNPTAGNGDFAIHLRGASAESLAVLVIGGSAAPIVCGPCTLYPAVESVYYAMTDSDGDASVEIPLGLELAGLGFYSQWAIFAAGGACTLADLNFSRALFTTIGSQP